MKFTRNEDMSRIEARLWLSGVPLCAGPLCNNPVRDGQKAVFLIRGGSTLAFCGPECHLKACEEHVHGIQVDRKIKEKGNLIRLLGYGTGEQ